MVDVMCYRIAIGLFYSKAYGCLVSTKRIKSFDISDFLQDVLNILTLSVKVTTVTCFLCFLQVYSKNEKFLIMLLVWLIVCGDVEKDPGPSSDVNISQLSIILLIIRSIRNKISILEDIASDYSIICVTETHLDDNVDTDDICIQGFQKPFRADRTAHGGGILIYVSSSLCANRVRD